MHFNRKTIILASCLLILILIILRVIGTIQSRNYEQVLKQGVIKITPYWSENKVIIDEVRAAVSQWPVFAKTAGVSAQTIKLINTSIGVIA